MSKSEFIHVGEAKKEQVQTMFDGIAHRYDFLNHALSFGVDLYWRRQVVKQLQLKKGQVLLDVATGTGDQTFTALKAADITAVGLDFSFKMLEQAQEKIIKKGLDSRFQLIQGDAENLPFEDSVFDALTISYGIRNVGTIPSALNEFYRVLKPGGQVAILEFSEPEGPIFSRLYRFYFDHILPKIAGTMSSKSAYSYLPESVRHFPDRPSFKEMLTKVGFDAVSHRDLSFGITAIYHGRKS